MAIGGGVITSQPMLGGPNLDNISDGSVTVGSDEEFYALVDIFCQAQMWQHLHMACNEIIRQKGNDPAYRFWRAVAMTYQGSCTDAVRELEPLLVVPELGLAANAALIAAHKGTKVPDKDAIADLKEKAKATSKTSDEPALLAGARYFWHSDKGKLARQCVEKVLGKSKKNIEALCIFGWINLTSGDDRSERKAMQVFESVLKYTENKDISALLGRAKFQEMKKQYRKALDDLNMVIVSFPKFDPGLLEKARVLMIMGNWDEALSTAQRVLQRNPYSVDALRLICLYLLGQESKSDTTLRRLQDLKMAIDKHEPRNANLYFEASQMASRLCGGNPKVLKLSLSMVEHAQQMKPEDGRFLSEQGYQLMLLGRYEKAQSLFENASKIDDTDVGALYGRIQCKIYRGMLGEAAQELGFLQEISGEVGASAELSFLSAKLAWKKDKQERAAVSFLNKAVAAHMAKVESVGPGLGYFVTYNPHFMLEVVNEFMQFVSTEPRKSTDPVAPLLKRAIQLLQQLVQVVPGLLGAQTLLARAHYYNGDHDEAEHALASVLRLEPNHAPGLLISAQIAYERGDFEACHQALEQAKAQDFGIRDTPMFHLLQARLLQRRDKFEEALAELEAGMALPGVKTASEKNQVSIQDRISLFVELANVYAKQSMFNEAAKVMQDAHSEFDRTSEVVRVSLADADLAVKRRDFDTALNILKKVPEESVYFTRAKMRMGDIYLKHRKDERQYAACFQELAYSSNTVHGFILLGEAYMRIMDPEKAIRAYEHALKLDPKDMELASRIGRALVTTHDYGRALEYYENAVKSEGSKLTLAHELAELYLQLKKYEDSIRVLQEALMRKETIEAAGEAEDARSLMGFVKCHQLLATVYHTLREFDTARESLGNALALQKQALAELRDLNSEIRNEARKLASKINLTLAQYSDGKNPDEIKDYYEEALKYNENNEEARLELARLHMNRGDLEPAERELNMLLQINPNNKDGTLLYADIMFRQSKHEEATDLFQRLLEKNPSRFDALAKLIDLLRRAGRLADAPKLIKQAEKARPSAQFSAGLHYCKGLHYWFTNDPREALIQFNQCRQDGEWGSQALTNMIEIYLNPDNGEMFSETADAKGDNTELVLAAEKLLKELATRGDANNKFVVLEAYTLMASKDKGRIEQALNQLLQVAQEDRDYVPALLGLANAYVLQQQLPKAKNQLKRVSKMTLIPEHAQEFEQAWLMLAQTYINSGKMDLAQELCRKCLSHNKSSAKAWEQLGVIMEKEQAYRDAADNYEQAFQLTSESSPSIGFRLAFNYLKAKRFVEAVNVCHKVLIVDPAYPKIRKEILEKAWMNLRP